MKFFFSRFANLHCTEPIRFGGFVPNGVDDAAANERVRGSSEVHQQDREYVLRYGVWHHVAEADGGGRHQHKIQSLQVQIVGLAVGCVSVLPAARVIQVVGSGTSFETVHENPAAVEYMQHDQVVEDAPELGPEVLHEPIEEAAEWVDEPEGRHMIAEAEVDDPNYGQVEQVVADLVRREYAHQIQEEPPRQVVQEYLARVVLLDALLVDVARTELKHHQHEVHAVQSCGNDIQGEVGASHESVGQHQWSDYGIEQQNEPFDVFECLIAG